MKYEEALKKVQTDKGMENRVIVTLGYSTKLVLPHKDGMAMLQAMAQAELLDDSYGKPKRLVDFDRDNVTIQVMSAKEYQRYRLAALLNISPDEIKEIYEKGEATT